MEITQEIINQIPVTRQDNISFLESVGFKRYAPDADFWVYHVKEGYYKFKIADQEKDGCDWDFYVMSASGIQMYADCNFDNIKKTFFNHKEVLDLMLKNNV